MKFVSTGVRTPLCSRFRIPIDWQKPYHFSDSCGSFSSLLCIRHLCHAIFLCPYSFHTVNFCDYTSKRKAVSMKFWHFLLHLSCHIAIHLHTDWTSAFPALQPEQPICIYAIFLFHKCILLCNKKSNQKSDGFSLCFSLFKPSDLHDIFIILSLYAHPPLLLKQHQSRYLSFRVRPDRAFLSRFQIVCGHDVPG